MAMDYKKCVEFILKYATPGQRHELMGAPSKPWRHNKTTIHLTYFSMPDWLAVLSAAKSPASTGHSEDLMVDVLRGMAIESTVTAVADFMMINCMEPAELKRFFPRLLFGYKTATEQHQKSIADLLDGFTRKGSGRALLAELGRTRHTITAMPYWVYFMTIPGIGYHNATPKPIRSGQILSHITDGIPDDDKNAYAKGAPIGTTGTKGTGVGANVLLYYSAGTWTDAGYPKVLLDGTAGTNEPDEILFHELAHVTRMIRGKMTKVTVEGRPIFGDIEEYFATTIANIYLSEKGAPLRGAYGLGDPDAPKDWNVMKNPDGFYDNIDRLSMSPHQLMETFKNTQWDFYHDLAILGTPPRFNPPRIHFKLSQRIPV